jgi:hypothetical protein
MDEHVGIIAEQAVVFLMTSFLSSASTGCFVLAGFHALFQDCRFHVYASLTISKIDSCNSHCVGKARRIEV